MLQGSLDNFALDEVLGLLSGTSKTGQLEIAGNRGTGTLMFHQGRVVDGAASYTANGSNLEDVMFELLRYDEGTFTFHQCDVTPGVGAENVASVLANAEARLRDWRSIERVVPSLDHRVVPAAELPADEVTIKRNEWAALIVIASGCQVSAVCDMLDLGEVEGSRCIKDLAERQLVTVTEPTGSSTRAARVDSPEGFSVTIPVATAAPPAPPIDVARTAVPASVEEGAGPDPDPATPGPSLGSIMADRPPMPPAPGYDELPIEGAPSSDAGPGSDPAPGFEAVPGGGTTAGFEPATSFEPTGGFETATSFERAAGFGATDSFDAPPAAPAGTLPPAPPSPSEIAGFSAAIEDASELVEAATDSKGGGILARYLKGDD